MRILLNWNPALWHHDPTSLGTKNKDVRVSINTLCTGINGSISKAFNTSTRIEFPSRIKIFHFSVFVRFSRMIQFFGSLIRGRFYTPQILDALCDQHIKRLGFERVNIERLTGFSTCGRYDSMLQSCLNRNINRKEVINETSLYERYFRSNLTSNVKSWPIEKNY